MSELEQEILRALIGLAQAAKTVRTANPKPDLQSLLARVDELGTQLPRDADPALIHYLQKKSYEKAQLWLEGRAGEVSTSSSGRCG